MILISLEEIMEIVFIHIHNLASIFLSDLILQICFLLLCPFFFQLHALLFLRYLVYYLTRGLCFQLSRLDPVALKGLSCLFPAITVPIVPALGVQPCLAVISDAEWNDGIVVPIWLPAPGAEVGIGAFKVVVEPFHNAALEGHGFGFRRALPAIDLCDTGPLVEEGAPVFRGPTLRAPLEPQYDCGLVE
jgi:hypothetical protein